jgi:hypothetical protein
MRTGDNYVDNYRYLEKDKKALVTLNDIIDMELRFSRTEPYRSLGRYIHLLVRKL